MKGDRRSALLGAAGLALLVPLLAPVGPLVLLGVPLALQLLAFRTGEPIPIAGAVLLLLLAFRSVPDGGAPLWYGERGWALVLGGGFVAATAWLGRRADLVARGVLALGLAFGAVGVVGGLDPDALRELDWLMERRLSRSAGMAVDWIAGIVPPPGGDPAGLDATMARVVELQLFLYPGLLGLASLAALAAGWYVVGRLGGREAALGAFREFRFHDGLVWVLIAGLLVLVLPVGGGAVRAAGNAVFLMGGLYLLRGAAVLLWTGGALIGTGWGVAVWTVAAVLLYPLALTVAVLVGLGDTWIDIRARVRRLRQGDG